MMTLDDWLLFATSVVIPLSIFYLNKRVPKRYGGHIIPKKGENPMDHFARWTEDGKPLPSKWSVRQKWIARTIDFFLLAVPVLGLIRFALKALRLYSP